jgi:hypothetical protein
MTNPTSNFGWQMPTPTDLVTDLPADFEVFGQAVDTSMADLKGGTTGQILSKATNTDMDFTWITNDVGDITNIAVTSPITGGGSSGSVTIGVSAASTSASGVVQLSDSTSTTSSVLASTPTATKSAYDLANTANTTANSATTTANAAYAAGFTNNFFAGKNKIINGNFDIWQRGTTFSTTDTYSADRWKLYLASAGTVTRNTALVPTGSKYAARITSNSAGFEGGFYQSIETDNALSFAGKTVTFSTQIAGTVGKTALLQISYSTADDVTPFGSWTAAATSPNLTVSGSYQTFSLTAAIPSNARSIRIAHGTGGTLASTEFLSFAQSQLEAGSVATPFQTASGSIGGELALCQRYYYRTTASALFSYFSAGNNYGATTNYSLLNLPVTLRTAPASIETTGTAANYRLAGGGVATTCSVVPAIDQTGTNQISILATVASGLTVGYAASLGANNTTAAYIGVSAEL